MNCLMKISNRTALAAATGIFVLSLAGAATAQETAAGTDENIVELDKMIVTAQKREQALGDIPQSVTVLGEETFERQQADKLQDYLALIPGLSITTNDPGVTRITLRGINTGGVASTVGVYVDEVPFGSSSGLANGAIYSADFDTDDLARLEVLRGPQGTLYGASSLGGVLKFVTNAPSTAGFEGRAKLGFESVEGGGLGKSATGMLNVPLGDRVAIRANAFYRFDDGFIGSVGNNPIASLDPDPNSPTFFQPDPSVNVIQGTRIADNINEQKTSGGRVSALFEASDAFSLRLTAMTQNIENGAATFFDADPATLQPLYSDLAGKNGELVQTLYHPSSTDTEYQLYSATADWDLGFADFLSSTSYGIFSQDTIGDGSFFAPIITLLFGDRDTRPLSAIQFQTVETKKFTQELRLTSPDNDRFEWLLGGYYTREKSAIDPQDLFAVEAGTETPATGVPRLTEVFLKSIYEEQAVFANATWHIAPRFDLTFGGRASRNEQDASLLIDNTNFFGPFLTNDLRSSEDVFTYSVAPRFELNDDASVYARIATGYRPGGPNVLPPGVSDVPFTYDSDTTKNYEVGLKADWLDNKLGLDIAAYYIDWEDIQLFAVINQTGVNTNGGTAVSKGVEFTATARPTRGLTFSLNGAYTDAYLTEDTPAATGGFNRDPLPYVPDWSVNLNGDYEWTVLDNATAYVGASLSYIGDRTADFGTRLFDPADPTSTTEPIREVPSYETVDLRAGLYLGRWELQAYVKNLTDERGITRVFGGGNPAFSALPNNAVGAGVIRPRTFGVSIATEF